MADFANKKLFRRCLIDLLNALSYFFFFSSHKTKAEEAINISHENSHGHLRRSRNIGKPEQIPSAIEARPQENHRQLPVGLHRQQEGQGWLQGGLLLHQLVPVPPQDRQVHSWGHHPRSVHPHHLCFRVAQEGQALVVREQRRDERWEDWALWANWEFEEGES